MSASGAQTKKDINTKGILLLGLVLLLIAPAAYWFIDWKVAWVLLLLAPLVAYRFFVPDKFARVFAYAYAIYVIAFLTATVLQIQLAENPKLVNVIEEHALLRFLLGGDERGFAKQVLFSVLAGVLAGVIVVNVPLFAIMLISSEWVLALRKDAGIDRKKALRYLWSLIMGINYPWLIIERGQVTESKPKGVLADLGGPGNAVIRPGHAVVFERHGAITQVIGPGMVRLKRFEQIRAIVELQRKWKSDVIENVLTKDRIPLRMNFGVGFQIEPRSEVDKRPESHDPPHGIALTPIITDGVFEVYEGSIRKAVFDTAADWLTVSFAVGENLLRDIVATYHFDQIFKRRDEGLEVDAATGFDPDDRTVREIEKKILEAHSSQAPSWGVYTRAVDIKSVEIPAEAQQQMFEWWRARWRRRVASEEAVILREQLTSRGEGEAAAIKTIEQARAQEQDRLINSLCNSIQMIQQTFSPADLKLAERLLAVMERLSRALSGADTSTTVRYVEALERMAGEAGTKVLMVGQHREWLPPLLRDGEDKKP